MAENGCGDYVFLLHGIAKSSRDMRSIEKYLRKEGFATINCDYPSRKYSIERLAREYLAPMVTTHCRGNDYKIHFVTHSMGGLVVRQYLKTTVLDNIGRVVMLCPPNQGSELADFLRHNFLYQWFYGPAGQELTTDTSGLPKQLGKVTFELGIITGDWNINPFSAFILPGKNDGRVTVENSKVEGMKDHMILHTIHSGILAHREALRQICSFLKQGHFAPQ